MLYLLFYIGFFWVVFVQTNKWFILGLSVFSFISILLYHTNHIFMCGVTSTIAFILAIALIYRIIAICGEL
jgi:hypothetical protein